MNGTIFTLRNLYRDGTICLEKAGIADAKLDAWYLLEYETRISRAMFLADPDKEVEKDKAEHYRKDIETRAQRIPLQHITGEQEFMGLDFKVNEHVLIPRQDTETLVEEALKKIRPGMQILDMCTGSGCILESILKFAERKGICVSGTGCDIMKETASHLMVLQVITFIAGTVYKTKSLDSVYDAEILPGYEDMKQDKLE